MVEQQKEFIFSPYIDLYDKIIGPDNLLRKINELIDFSFVYKELIDKYCLDNGRMAESPIKLFKYLLLKIIFDLSDIDIVERSKYDMSIKYFLDMAPEADVIHPSLLTKFRKLRLKDVNLLDMLINKTVDIAIEKGIIKSTSIIVDSTHTKARYTQKTARQILQERATKLRRSVYEIDETMKECFPSKNTEDSIEKEIEYCKKLICAIKENEVVSKYPKVSEKLNMLEEIVQDDIEHLKLSKDPDAKLGHKTQDTSFWGYKTHIAMTEERIITAATVTSGEKNDGKELEKLYRKSKDTGMKIEAIIGDGAYSEKANIELAQNEGIQLVAKLNPSVTQGCRKEEDKFPFNKDAGMPVCTAGYLATRKSIQGKKGIGKNQKTVYFFDVKKCKVCSLQKGCYKEGSKRKTYGITIKCDTHKAQMEFQESEEFKEKAKERYKIEAKNGEIKNRHGYDVASSSGIDAMEMQAALTLFTVNVKRIIKLMGKL